MKSKFLIAASLFVVAYVSLSAQQKSYTVATYNVENLFDNDGIAQFNDYKTVDRDGNPQYTAEDVYNKAANIARILTYLNKGEGPDVVVFNELESDHSDPSLQMTPDMNAWWAAQGNSSLKELLQAEVALSSDQIVWLALQEAGINYTHVAVGVPEQVMGKPRTTQMNVVMSKLPIDAEKVQKHPVERARAILEVPIVVEDERFILFANHWKSGASGADEEVIRAQNASVLRQRLNVLMQQNPSLDILVTGDLNVNYDQHVSMKTKVSQVSISDILGVNGLEADPNSLYNLWHELPVEERGSDTYRGRWGTLMHSILNHAWYDDQGLQYIDQSFGVLKVEGVNAYAHSSEPIRWSSFNEGYGFSDHYPIYFSFQLADGAFQPKVDFSQEDVRSWTDIRRERVSFSTPTEVLSFDETSLEENELTKFYRLDPSLFSNDLKTYSDAGIGLYIPIRSVRTKIERGIESGKLDYIIGRFDTYRGAIQFVIEEEYALIYR